MAINVYTSLDVGAPALAGDAAARFRQILMACLVTGYGSKPGAGWSVGHDVAGGYSLWNGTGYLNVTGTGNEFVALYLMEAITDPSSALAGGINRRSEAWYDGSSTTNRQYIRTRCLIGSNPHWSVVADEQTAIVMVGGGQSNPTADGLSVVHGNAVYLGNYINASGLEGASTFCALGGTYFANTNYQHGLGNGFNGTALRNPFTGMTGQGDTYGTVPARFGGGGLVSKSPLVPSRLMLVRTPLVTAGGVVGGFLRGLMSEPTLGTALLSEVCTLFGLSDIWQRRVQLIELPNGQNVMPVFPHASLPGYFVSLDPADWG